MAKNLMIVFGGMSSEHEVSCVSAATVVKAINTEKYNVYLVGITKDGQWIYTDSVASIESGLWKKGTTRATLTPDTKHELLLSRGWRGKEDHSNRCCFPGNARTFR